VSFDAPAHAFDADLVVVYRISSCGYDKKKLAVATKQTCLRNAIHRIEEYNPKQSVTLFLIGDSCKDDLWKKCQDIIQKSKFASPSEHKAGAARMAVMLRTSLGSGAASFHFALDLMCRNVKRDDSCVYMLEDDYLHTEGALEKIVGGLQFGTFSTGYDHPDKYGKGARGVPLLHDDGTEKDTRVHLGDLCHYRRTSSTTMTFAVRAESLRRLQTLFHDFVDGTHPHDFYMFLAAREVGDAHVVTTLPGCSTHCETSFLTPFVDWNEVATGKVTPTHPVPPVPPVPLKAQVQESLRESSSEIDAIDLSSLFDRS